MCRTIKHVLGTQNLLQMYLGGLGSPESLAGPPDVWEPSFSAQIRIGEGEWWMRAEELSPQPRSQELSPCTVPRLFTCGQIDVPAPQRQS